MDYALPKKIQMMVSQAKWQLQAEHSVLVLVGVVQLREQAHFQHSDLADHLLQVCEKAKALDITVLQLHAEPPMQTMLQLGEYVSQGRQLVIAGLISPMLKQLIEHISSISSQICVINDAILLDSQAQHIQYINRLVQQGLQHMSSQTLRRLWTLSAPSHYILSDQGILLALAEQLQLNPLDIDPYTDLRHYGLDSVSMVSLIGLWRANGAHIDYEFFSQHCTLAEIFIRLKATPS